MTGIINLWAGPGAGKSTVASDLFAEMKWQGKSVELVSEYAKEVTWEGHHNILSDQLFVSAQQNRKLQRLIDKVDWIITDSPLLLCIVYIPNHYQPSFKDMLYDMWDQYDNYNYYINRKKAYVPVGRSQTEAEAIEVDNRVLGVLTTLDIPYTIVHGDREAKQFIIRDLELS